MESVVDIAEHLDKLAMFAPLRSDDGLFRGVSVASGGGAFIGLTGSIFLPTRSGVLLSNKEAHGCAHGVRRTARPNPKQPRLWVSVLACGGITRRARTCCPKP